jgi:hypothetical protein
MPLPRGIFQRSGANLSPPIRFMFEQTKTVGKFAGLDDINE